MLPDTPFLLESTRSRFPQITGDIQLEPILKGGSDRRYYRITEDGAHSGMLLMAFDTNRPDNINFSPATRLLEKLETSVPRIVSEDTDNRLLWLEDVGTEDLHSFANSSWEVRAPLYKAALTEVAILHRIGEEDLTNTPTNMLGPTFDSDLYRWEQGYFFEHFVRRCTDLSESEADSLTNAPFLNSLADGLASLPRFLVHRDFQSENIMVKDGKVFLIDYQGLRFGRPEYDIASLIYDPYVTLAKDERSELILFYQESMGLEGTSFRECLAKCATQRLMQALGAYGNLGLNLGKAHYLDFMVPAMENLVEATNSIPELEPIRDLRTRIKIPEITDEASP